MQFSIFPMTVVYVTQRKKCALFFPRNKNAALPVRAQKDPLTISGLKKMGPGWRLRPRDFAPQASVMASGVQDDVSHDYTCFIRRGEDARLHGRFLSAVYPLLDALVFL